MYKTRFHSSSFIWQFPLAHHVISPSAATSSCAQGLLEVTQIRISPLSLLPQTPSQTLRLRQCLPTTMPTGAIGEELLKNGCFDLPAMWLSMHMCGALPLLLTWGHGPSRTATSTGRVCFGTGHQPGPSLASTGCCRHYFDMSGYVAGGVTQPVPTAPGCW